MKNYESMSDFEINCAVAIHLGMQHAFFFPESEGSFCEEVSPHERGLIWQTKEDSVCGYVPSNGNMFNPCNSWKEAGPIIERYEISLISRRANNEWKSELYLGTKNSFSQYASCWHKNPLRAAMVSFLMMKDEENGKQPA